MSKTPKQNVSPAQLGMEIGTLVDVRKDDGSIFRTKTRSLPWGTGFGMWIVSVDGISGGYNLERVTPVKKTKVAIDHLRPPIPTRIYDYHAYVVGDEDAKSGDGATREAALTSLADVMNMDVADFDIVADNSPRPASATGA